MAYFMRFVFFRNSISVRADLNKSDCDSLIKDDVN